MRPNKKKGFETSITVTARSYFRVQLDEYTQNKLDYLMNREHSYCN